MLKKITPLIIAVYLTVGIVISQQKTELDPYNDQDAYDIYSSLIPNDWPTRVAKAKTLVIRAETVNYTVCLIPEKEFEPQLGPAIEAFKLANEKPSLVQQKTE